ncbi:hypothetical protein [Methyloglobulus sp.]|uniref:hypothetical protein n=1 Tax=Methyloglobulus sp. TaxID=2518622 RepID=UPI003988EDE5
MTSITTLLEARNLVVNYKNYRAINGLDLSVPAGCVYALLGGRGQWRRKNHDYQHVSGLQ